ncbi:MAG TPA: helix-turn-helix transcriptional regulator [Streptomyces sp.]|nr:helix-turn-helix transcriptional regulator [Streptomyces sp.]
MPSRDVGEGTGGVVSQRRDEVGKFAALLRRLKERTDRSYGSLARRLHMNTSTLHRYCAGDAVPVDFSPVERFAALCGATAEERLDLHRHWMAAVAARRRPRPEQDSPTGPGHAAEDPAGGAEDPADGTAWEAEKAAGGVDGAAEGAEHAAEGTAGAAGGAEDAAGGPARAEDAAEDAAGADAAGGPAGAEDTAENPAGAEDAAGGPAGAEVPLRPSPTGGSPWYRRRRTAGAVAVSAALLLALGGLSALSANGSPTDGRARAAVPSGTASAGPSAGSRPSDTPRSPSPGAASGSPSAAGGGAGKPAPRDGGSRPARPEKATGTPLTWTADSHVWSGGCGHDYVIGKSPDRVPPPPAPQDAATWAATQAAVHGRETMVRISVQGGSSAAVVLEALRVRVVGRSAPAPGSVYAMEQGCGGSLTPRHFAVDLDKDRPIARPVGGNDAGTPIPAMSMPYRVSAEDPAVLLVTARTAGCDCRWYLELDWSSRGRTGTVRVDDAGRPFRTSAVEGLPRHMYDTSTRAWTAYTP